MIGRCGDVTVGVRTTEGDSVRELCLCHTATYCGEEVLSLLFSSYMEHIYFAILKFLSTDPYVS